MILVVSLSLASAAGQGARGLAQRYEHAAMAVAFIVVGIFGVDFGGVETAAQP